MKRLFLLTIIALQQMGFATLPGSYAGTELMAQEITVDNCKFLSAEEAADQTAVLDNNGRPCGLVKVMADGITNLCFPNKNEYMGEVQYKSAEQAYYVYVPEMLSKLSFTHNDYLPGEINLRDFGYKVKSGRTYLVTLKASAEKARDGRTVTFRLNPAMEATLVYGSQSVQIPSDGIVEITHDPTAFSYTVTADGYKPSKGTIGAGTASEARHVGMNPITVTVDVQCNEKSAHVFVDNIDYGKVGSKNLPLGYHHLRVALKGYLDASRDETITSSTSQLSFQIAKNTRKQIDIHATPVTINSSSRYIYKDCKRIKEWHNSGDVVYLMPDRTYLISDDHGRNHWLEVGNNPMEITVNGKTMEILKQ